MSFTVNFIERKVADTQSIEGVFRQIASGIKKAGVRSIFSKLPYPNSFVGLIKNLLNFRPSRSDLYHVTGHIHFITLILPKHRTILTIHDLGILNNRSGLRRWLIKKLYFDIPVSRAGAITAISEATKEALIQTTGIRPDRVTVVENPIKKTLTPTPKTDFNFRLPTILQIGTAKHKNLENLVKAVGGLSCRLVILGSLDPEQQEMLRTSEIEFDNFFDLDEEGMCDQYQKADIVVFCSKFEGFGLPIIEAQAMKTPLITSRRSPMKEVAGDGALLADPEDPSSIREAIDRMISDPAMRMQIVEKGLANIQRFESDRIARKYIEVYESLLTKVKSQH